MAVGTDEDFEIIDSIIAALPERERRLYYAEWDVYDQVSGTACPTLENIERYEPQIMAEMARRAREGYSL